MQEKNLFDKMVEIEYEKFNNLIAEETKQKLKIINEWGLEDIIDDLLIKGGLIDREWFKRFKIEPYLKERFRYHFSWNMNMTKIVSKIHLK